MPKNKSKIIIILGPTASGKTKLAVNLARVFNGEIISADSRQIYRHMNIGTGKDIKEYKEIKYHLIDILNPDEIFSVAQWQDQAKNKISQIIQKDKLPIICGGTGLYIESLINNYSIPQIAPDIELRDNLSSKTILELQKTIKEKNITIKDSDQKNKTRLIRAIEKKSSKSIKQKPSPYEFLVIGIEKTKEDLHKKINQRTEKMFAEGLVEETQNIIKKYNDHIAPILTIGYKETIDYLHSKTSLKEAIQLTQLHTRQYAKRQMTWFRGTKKRNPNTDIHWISDEKEAKKLIAKFIKNLFSN